MQRRAAEGILRVDDIVRCAAWIFDQQVEALLEVDVPVADLRTSEPQADFMQNRRRRVLLQRELLRLLIAKLQARLLEKHLEDPVMSLHGGDERRREFPSGAFGPIAQVEGFVFEQKFDHVGRSFDRRHLQELRALAVVVLRVVAAAFLERFKVSSELGLATLNHQAHHELRIDILNCLFGNLAVRVLRFEHLRHLVVSVSVQIDVCIVQEELDQLLLLRELRLLLQKSEKRRLVLLVREIRVAAVAQQNLDAFSDVIVVVVGQQVDQNLQHVLVVVLHVHLRLIEVLQKCFQIFGA